MKSLIVDRVRPKKYSVGKAEACKCGVKNVDARDCIMLVVLALNIGKSGKHALL